MLERNQPLSLLISTQLERAHPLQLIKSTQLESAQPLLATGSLDLLKLPALPPTPLDLTPTLPASPLIQLDRVYSTPATLWLGLPLSLPAILPILSDFLHFLPAFIHTHHPTLSHLYPVQPPQLHQLTTILSSTHEVLQSLRRNQ